VTKLRAPLLGTYEAPSGQRPVWEWILDLSADDRRLVGWCCTPSEKKTQKTPSEEIDIALKRKREVE